jgi:predicted metalloendopeptidase
LNYFVISHISASVILSSMNADVDPCVDFYEYACGNWIRKHPIPDDAPSVSNFENLGQDLEFALRGTYNLIVY